MLIKNNMVNKKKAAVAAYTEVLAVIHKKI